MTSSQDDTTPEPQPDTTSDPSLDDGESSDWTGEGGAATAGPATDAADDPEHPSKD
ncbi:hypothetical protein [Nocardioides psychrotolerans]|uniref:Uncharacterized protein n=1 Tax=Nocardioides psychrotolerans TaxID=1005945 RepID=A0A1I3DPD8_9ACTN|nr:hypothetical protein [Nocardioides psychrotolerans]SFH88614.1 hypothetical protein SAMN05216561_10323 [Nocardioides psychrotolerans]